MEILVNHPRLSIRRQLAESIIEIAKVYGVIKPLQFVHSSAQYSAKLEAMRSLPSGTIGSSIAEMLDNEGLKLIPRFEDHDLKHLILGYGMSTIDELRMQAYLFGNGNRSISCMLFLSSALLLPSSWNTLYTDFKKGKNSPSILRLSIDDCMREPIEVIRKHYKIR